MASGRSPTAAAAVRRVPGTACSVSLRACPALPVRREPAVVTINYTGNISTSGQNSIAVYAESLGSTGNGRINVTLGPGTIVGGSGNMAAGVGIVGGSSNNLTIAQSTSISTGTGGFAIAATGGTVATGQTYALTVVNNGTVIGNVDLGKAANSFTNNGTFYPGTVVNINNQNETTGWTPPGASLATTSPNITPFAGTSSTADVLIDNGITNVAGPGVVGTTSLQTSSYTQTSTGTLQVDVNYSNMTADKLAITGTASLSGKIAPNLVALPTNGQTSQAPLTVLTAASVSGTPTVVNTAATTWSVNPTSTGVTLALSSLNFDNAEVKTKQAANVADHLQALYLTGAFGSLGPAMLALANMPAGDSARYSRALAKLGGEGSTVSPGTGSMQSTRFAKALNSCPVFVGETALLNEHSCMWSKVDGGIDYNYNPGGVTGYRNSWTAFSAGGQQNIGNDWFLGGAFSIGQSALNDNDQTFHASSDDYAAGVVVKKQIADVWLLSLSGTYMYNSTGTSRLVRSELVTGMPPVALAHMDIHTVGGRGEIAYYADFGRVYAKPLVDFDVVDTRVPGYAESGAGIWDLKFKAASKTQFGVSPALELGQRINLNGGVLRAYGSAGFSYWTNPGWQQVANFEGETSGVPGFANVFTGSSTYAVGRVGAEVVGLYNMTGRIQYDVLGNSHFLSQVISARIGYLF